MNRFLYYTNSSDSSFLDKEYGGNPKPSDYGFTSKSIADYEETMDNLVKSEPDKAKLGKKIFVYAITTITALLLIQNCLGVIDDFLVLLSIGIPIVAGFFIYCYSINSYRRKVASTYKIVRITEIDHFWLDYCKWYNNKNMSKFSKIKYVDNFGEIYHS